MIILSDCITEKLDEGCLKVANSLTKRIKERLPHTMVVSYGIHTEQSDMHLELNKLLLNRSLINLLRNKKESVLYIPFASNTKASAIRAWILSCMTRNKVSVVFVLRFPMDWVTKFFLRMSKVQIIALSQESYNYYNEEIGNPVFYLKTGVDTTQFVPVTPKVKKVLQEKYDVAFGKKVLLHVGHLKSGRNIEKLLDVNQNYHVFLVVSSVTESEQDKELRVKLNARPNTTIIDYYIEHIEEVYQMADVYFFPVVESENCIDVPLSVLEAAACNIPIVTTDYGELKALKGKDGFCFLSALESEELNRAIDEMTSGKEYHNRESVLGYDWEQSINCLISQNGWDENEKS